jgi:hypothetical protein
MKKHVLLTIVTLALSLSWVGCNKSGKLNTTSKFTVPAGPVALKTKWPLGERVVQSMELKQNAEISVPNQPNPINQEMTMGQEYGLTVLKENADGGHEVEMEYLSVRMMMTMGGKPMVNYDSAKKSSGDSANPMAAMFQKIIGAKIQYFMDASNQVERIEGVDALVGRLESSGPANMANSLKSMFNEGYFKQIMDSSRLLPSKPVQPGDTWPIQMEIPMGPLGIMEMDYMVTFQSWEQHGKRTCARLEIQGTVKSKPDPNSKPAGMSMTILDGNVSGVSWFDPELGMVIDTTANQDMKMNMTMPANPRGNTAAAGQTQTITSLLKQVITIKLESVK